MDVVGRTAHRPGLAAGRLQASVNGGVMRAGRWHPRLTASCESRWGIRCGGATRAIRPPAHRAGGRRHPWHSGPPNARFPRPGWGMGLRGESFRLGGQRGGEPGDEDVEAAFELGGAVVAGQDGARLRSRGNSPMGSRCSHSRSRSSVSSGFSTSSCSSLTTWPCRNPNRAR